MKNIINQYFGFIHDYVVHPLFYSWRKKYDPKSGLYKTITIGMFVIPGILGLLIYNIFV